MALTVNELTALVERAETADVETLRDMIDSLVLSTMEHKACAVRACREVALRDKALGRDWRDDPFFTLDTREDGTRVIMNLETLAVDGGGQAVGA